MFARRNLVARLSVSASRDSRAPDSFYFEPLLNSFPLSRSSSPNAQRVSDLRPRLVCVCVCVNTTLRSEEARDRVATVGERNTIRRALRCEAAWRRRRSVVLLKTHLEKQPPQEKIGAATASTPSSAAARPRLGNQSPNRVGGSGNNVGGGEDIRSGRLKRAAGTSSHSLTAKSAKAAAAAARGGSDGVDHLLPLRRVLEGVVDLAAREEALFRQIVMFL